MRRLGTEILLVAGLVLAVPADRLGATPAWGCVPRVPVDQDGR